MQLDILILFWCLLIPVFVSCIIANVQIRMGLSLMK